MSMHHRTSVLVESKAYSRTVDADEATRRSLRERHARVTVPTDDQEVRLMLRAMAEPVCYFAEEAPDRRERLRIELAKRAATGPDGEQQIIELYQTLKQQTGGKHQPGQQMTMTTTAAAAAAAAAATAALGHINDGRPFFSEAEDMDALRDMRLRAASLSLHRARRRIALQKRARERALAPAVMRQQLRESKARLRQLAVQASVPGGERPLSCVALSALAASASSSSGSGSDGGAADCCCCWVATGCAGGTVAVWNSADGALLRKQAAAHKDKVTGLAWHPRQSDVYASTSADGTAVVHRRGEIQTRLRQQQRPGSSSSDDGGRLARCAFLACGPFLAACSWRKCWLMWDVSKQRLLLKQSGHVDKAHCLAVHPDCSLLATGDLAGVARLWDLRSGRAVMGLDSHAQALLSMAFAPDGVRLATGAADHCVKMWDLRKRSEATLAAHHSNVTAVRFARFDDGKVFGCNALCGTVLVSASFDHTVKLWTVADLTLAHTLLGHESRVADVDIASDASLVVSAGHDKTWKLWRVDSDVIFNKEEKMDLDGDDKTAASTWGWGGTSSGSKIDSN